MADSLQLLVERYLEEPTPPNREAVVVAAVPLVRSLIGKLSIPNHLLATREDLENTGLYGLLQALDSYDPEIGTKFVTHAYRRVRGSLIDYLRSIDVLSRSKRRKLAEAQQAIETLRQMLGTEPQDQDVADYLGISLAEYHTLLTQAQYRFSLSLFNTTGDDESQQTVLEIVPNEEADEDFEHVERRLTLETLEKLIADLPERQQTILGLYYIEDLTLREIGQILDLTEARISQILGKILLTLKGQLTLEHSSAT